MQFAFRNYFENNIYLNFFSIHGIPLQTNEKPNKITEEYATNKEFKKEKTETPY